eukprot:TRINITY_DN22153_c0_g1_i1.p1 TRINITY_DN22153_c0_g1~~TRINITY_DN22153_c0_g1_i1.p1  ORF type:complete len:430 (-),score=86.55 TRINITY_DN22153_c0_g1_i1:6-1262(-)
MLPDSIDAAHSVLESALHTAHRSAHEPDLFELARAHAPQARRLLEPPAALVLDVLPSDPNVIQLKVCKQFKNPSCGFYALANALTVLLACTAEESAVSEYFARLQCPGSFWTSFVRRQRELALHAQQRGDRHYPWKTTEIAKGAMERPYMTHLLGHLPDAWQECLSAVPSLGRSEMRSGTLAAQEVERLQRAFQEFETRFSALHGFLVGVSNHWIAIVAIKFGPAVQLIVLDSRNRRLLSAPDQFAREAAELELEDDKQDVRAMFLRSMHESHEAVQVLSSCVRGHRSLLALYAKNLVDAVTESCAAHVPALQTSPHEAPALEGQLIQWWDNFYPVPVLGQTLAHICALLAEQSATTRISQSTSDVQRLRGWMLCLDAPLAFLAANPVHSETHRAAAQRLKSAFALTRRRLTLLFGSG